jgi:hypothetical protein
MLYGDGSGTLATVSGTSSAGAATVADSKNLIEGLAVDFLNAGGTTLSANHRIIAINRDTNRITFTGSFSPPSGTIVVVQGSHNKEITGLKRIFEANTTLYGVNRSVNTWMNPHRRNLGAQLSEGVMQETIDLLSERYASEVDFIVCSAAVKRSYQEIVSAFRRNIDIMELQGGYKALSYNGIPVISDRFVDRDSMYFLNSKDFKLHQLCDWKWLENESGRILKQNPGKPTYSATLVKYAELFCDKPCGQALITGIAV